MEDPPELTIEKLFTQPIQKPFSYDLKLGQKEEQTQENAFEHVKKIFVNGLIYTTEGKSLETADGKTILIDKITKKEIEYVKKYMLSLGVEVVYKEYNLEDKDYYIRGLLYEIEKKDFIQATVTMDWKTQLIQTVNIKIEQSNYEQLMTIVKKHPEANYFLNLYKPIQIKDFVIKYVKEGVPNIMNIIYFKPASISDYHYQHKYYDNLVKHVR